MQNHRATNYEPTKLKRYSYIGIFKYLGCIKIFLLGGVRSP